MKIAVRYDEVHTENVRAACGWALVAAEVPYRRKLCKQYTQQKEIFNV